MEYLDGYHVLVLGTTTKGSLKGVPGLEIHVSLRAAFTKRLEQLLAKSGTPPRSHRVGAEYARCATRRSLNRP